VLKEGGAFIILALVAVINSVISLYYYAKVVKVMFLETPDPAAKAVAIAGYNFTLMVPLAVLTVVLGIYFSPLSQYTTQSLRFFVK
jgi:NADH-quinone oxidoreductase subunit N